MREEGGNESLQAVLESLSQQLWAPLRKALPPGTRSVIISPDGELNFVSFAALLTEDRAFVSEKFLISYVATARDLLPTRETRSTKKDLLVWANPDFGAAVQTEPASTNWLVSSRAASARAFRDLTFRPLTGAEQEGRRLQAHAADFGFQRVELHLGKDATEAELRRVDSPRVLHLATHGFFLPEIENPRRQNNFLPDARFVAGSSSLVNPMLRSGLALAGAQTTLAAWKNGELVPAGDDGIVTAEEISRLNLRDTWLVVLSACDTGMGEARSGEGVLGLRRGFIQAGAQNLLLTLWPIDDQTTVGFIGDFYRTATHTSDAPRALAEVQRGWLHRLRKAKGIAEAAKTAGPFILSFQRGQ